MYKWKKLGIAWIAMFAMLAATLMPSMSAAVAPATAHDIPISWESICVQEHATQHHAAQQPAPASYDHDGHANHCPLCVKQSHAVGLVPVVTVEFAEPAEVSTTVFHPDALPSPSFAWTFHPTRAPPAFA